MCAPHSTKADPQSEDSTLGRTQENTTTHQTINLSSISLKFYLSPNIFTVTLTPKGALQYEEV